MEHGSAAASLLWQVELGATEAIAEAPINRFEVTEMESRESSVERRRPAPAEPSGMAKEEAAQEISHAEAVQEAERMARAAGSRDELLEAIGRYERCALKAGAHKLVFSDGNPEAEIMIVGEAPGYHEDRQGLPFVGPAGQMLDLMFAEIGYSRRSEDPKRALYITNTLPWRPPGNRNPEPGEIEMMKPFVERHIELASPRLLVLMGNFSCLCLLGRMGISRLRKTWHGYRGLPARAMFHPSYLLRTPVAKRESWFDLLSVKERMEEMGNG